MFLVFTATFKYSVAISCVGGRLKRGTKRNTTIQPPVTDSFINKK